MRFTGKLRFVLILTGLLTFGFIATSLTSYWIAHSSLEDQIAESTLPLTSDNIYSEIQTDLLRPIFISSLMAQDTFLRDWIIAGENDPTQVIRFLETIQQKYQTITAYFISDKSRKYYHPEGIIKEVSHDDPADAWYFRARRMQEEYEINIDSDTADAQRTTIFINYRIEDYSSNYLGIVGVGLESSAVQELINTYQKRYDRRIYFIDRQGDIRMRGDDNIPFSAIRDDEALNPHATNILTSPSTSLRYERDGQDIFLNSRLVEEFNWFLVVEQTGTPGEDQLLNSLALNMAAAAGIILIILVLANFTIGGYQSSLEKMASTDKLTGLLNRQSFETVLDQVLAQSNRKQTSTAALLLDMDFFKEINDTHGHLAGDQALIHVAAVTKATVRKSDVICRWGGEEFLVILPECDLDEASRIAETLRTRMESSPVYYKDNVIALTASIGVTLYQQNESSDMLLQRADQALYEAKNSGRNQIRVTS